MFLLEGFLVGIVGFLQKLVYAWSGENLTYKLRLELFKGIIYKQLAWFDRKDRAPGILSNILSEDVN